MANDEYPGDEQPEMSDSSDAGGVSPSGQSDQAGATPAAEVDSQQSEGEAAAQSGDDNAPQLDGNTAASAGEETTDATASGQPSTVTRRRFLAWLGAAAGVTAVGAWAASEYLGGNPVNRLAEGVEGIANPMEKRNLKFNLSGMKAATGRPVEFTLGSQVYTVQEGLPATASDELASKVDLSRVTHSVMGVQARADQVTIGGLTTTDDQGNLVCLAPVVVVPKGAVVQAAEAAVAARVTSGASAGESEAVASVYQSDPRLTAFGAVAPPASAAEVGALADYIDLATEAAVAMVYQFPGVSMAEPTAAAITDAIIRQTPVLDGLIDALRTFFTNVGVYGDTVPVLAFGGEQARLDDNDPNSPLMNSFQPFVQPGSAFQGEAIPDEWAQTLKDAWAAAASSVVAQVQDTLALKDVAWTQPEGWQPEEVEVTPVAAANGEIPEGLLTGATVAGTGVTFAMDSDAKKDGIQIRLEGAKEETNSAGTKYTLLTLGIENDLAMFAQPLLQFLDGNGKIMDPLTFGMERSSDSDWSTEPPGSLAVPAPTVMGVPLPNLNYKTFDVALPPGAVGVRVVTCTSGAGNGWEKLFPEKDGSSGRFLYSQHARPEPASSAVTFTSIVSVGLPALFLMLDVANFIGSMGKAFGAVIDINQNRNAGKDELQVWIKDYFKSGVGSFSKGLKNLEDSLLCLLRVQQTIGNDESWGFNRVWRLIQEFGTILWGLLQGAALRKLYTVLLEQIIAGKASKAVANLVPFLGPIFTGLAVAADIAAISIAGSQMHNKTAAIDYTASGRYAAKLTVNRDRRDATFPKAATRYRVTTWIGDKTSVSPVVNVTDFDPLSVKQLQVQLPKVPFGGRIKHDIKFFTKEGFTVGSGSTGWLDNFSLSELPQSPEITITEFPVPVGANTVFRRRWTTTWDSAKDDYAMSNTEEVPGSLTSLNCGAADAICRTGSIAVGTATGLTGFAYQAGDGWYVRQIGVSDNPGDGAAAIAQKFTAPPLLVYDSEGSQLTGGANFLLEPRDGNPERGLEVRALDLAQEGLGYDPQNAVARFESPVDAVALHPSGRLAAVNTDAGTLHLVAPRPDALVTSLDNVMQIPLASTHAGTGNRLGDRPGLLHRPVDVAMMPNGSVMVLESEARRVSAFDPAGNPVTYFGSGTKSFYLPLQSDGTYYSVAADGFGYAFVAGYRGDGSDPDAFFLDIYDPTGGYVTRATGVAGPDSRRVGINAGSVVVDYFRNLYTTNFQPMLSTSGQVYRGANGVPEPSVSIWVAGSV